jgi:hypothetical protein
MPRRTAFVLFFVMLFASLPAFGFQRGSHSSRSYSSGRTSSSHTTVHGYTTRRGTHVQSYRKTTPDHSRSNNFTSRGNTNPYTGKRGYKKPY